MLKDIHVSQKISLKSYYVILIFVGTFVTGITVYNADNTPSFAKYDAMVPNYQIKPGELYQPKVIPISNQVEPSFLEFQVLLLLAVTTILIHLLTTLNLDKTLVENIQILNMV